jgi:hypothetical protein
MKAWGKRELATLELGDTRRSRRMIEIVETLAAKPGESVPRAFQGKAQMNATYYAWNSPYVTPDAILAAHRDATVERMRSYPVVVVPNDTTNLDFTNHDKVDGFGYLDAKNHRGLMAHTAVAVTPDGLMLGVLHQDRWARYIEELGKGEKRKQRPTDEKESRKWLDTLDAVGPVIPDGCTAVVTGDSEADIYELFVHPREANVELLVRSCQNRRVAQQALLRETIEAVLPCAHLTVEVKRADDRPARNAKLTLRFTTVRVLPPKNHPTSKGWKPVELQAVLAREEEPPSGVSEPIYWLLLTTLPVANAKDAARCVDYYRRRWVIERFHFVLKSGCKVQQLQLDSLDALETALATYNIVAWRLLYLTQLARQTPDAPCEVAFERPEWEALYVRIHKKTPPTKPPTLRETVRLVASLGGFLGRKGDGEPGVKTLWLGLLALHECVETYTAMRRISPPRDRLQTCRER